MELYPDLSSQTENNKTNCYAVRKGKQTGIFSTWEEIKPLVTGYPEASFKKFTSRLEAEKFMQGETTYSHVANIGTSGQVKMFHYIKKKNPENKSQNVTQANDESTKLKETPIVTIKQLVKVNVTPDISQNVRNNETISKSTKIINVYCDGSTFNNGKKIACGGIGIWFGEGDGKNVSEPFTREIPTNQKTEIYALTRTLKIIEQIIEENKDTLYECHIYTDSEHVINCLTKWIPTWKKNNWIKHDGKSVKNQELLEELSGVYYGHQRQYKLHHVKGHGKDPNPLHVIGNDNADKLAVAGSRQHPNYKEKTTKK